MWWDAAECLWEDPELFFPDGSLGRTARNLAAIARTVCARCPVREECLRMALELGAEFGVWGGTTPEERRRMARATAGRRTRELFEAPLSRPA